MKATKIVGGVPMTEFAMSQAFYEFKTAQDWREFADLRRTLDGFSVGQTYGDFSRFAASRGTRDGWDRCVAVINGKPRNCYRVGKFTIIADDMTLERGPNRLGAVKRLALWVAMALKWR